MEQEVLESNRHWTVAGLSVCSLLPLVDEILVSYVAKHEIDDRPAHDHNTGERLGPHLVNIGRRTQCEAMARYQLFERALIRLARGKNNGSGPRDPIIYFRRHGTSQIHQDHLEGCVDKEQESQVYYCPGADSMAATHGDDIIAEGEPEELDRLDEVSKRLVGGEVHGQYLKWHILHIEDQGLDTSCCDHQKPFQGWFEQNLGRRDPEALDELAEPEAKLYQQDTGMGVCVSSGRFDMRFCVKRQSAMMSRPRKMGDLRLSRCVV